MTKLYRLWVVFLVLLYVSLIAGFAMAATSVEITVTATPMEEAGSYGFIF